VKGVLAMARSGKAGSFDALKNMTNPGIRRSAGWLLGAQVDHLGWADSLMQQRGAARTNDDKRGPDLLTRLTFQRFPAFSGLSLPVNWPILSSPCR
jgi:hypothetical protein